MNRAAKVGPRVAAMWAEVLRRVPGSRLLVAGAGRSPSLPRTLAEAGIDPDRVEVVGRGPHERYLGAYRRVDVALDTYPYHGTTTTCDALWMGVPVVTMAGATHASRVGASLLSAVGLPDLVAGTPEQYVHTAAHLAGDLPRLAELRQTLRGRMAASGLRDEARFTRRLEAAYREMWRAWSSARRPAE